MTKNLGLKGKLPRGNQKKTAPVTSFESVGLETTSVRKRLSSQTSVAHTSSQFKASSNLTFWVS